MKNAVLLLVAIFSNSFLYAKTWYEIMHEKEALLGDACYNILKEQHEAFIAKTAPVIAHPVIKIIPIIENNEPLIDVREMNHERILMALDPHTNQPFAGPLYNSGLPSASKMRKEVWEKLEKMLSYLDILAPSFGYEPGMISINIVEGLRDLETQKKLFQNKADEIRTKNPSLSEEEVEMQTAQWVSPVKNNVPVHSTGAAVDIRLWNTKTEKFIDLGPFGVIWGVNNEAPTFSENLSDIQKLNRLYLLMASTQAGLINYVYEYWHHSSGDRYAAYWQEKDADKRCAHYGSV